MADENYGYWLWDNEAHVYRCSVCNHFPWRIVTEENDEIFIDLKRTNAYKYCPTCGMKMKYQLPEPEMPLEEALRLLEKYYNKQETNYADFVKAIKRVIVSRNDRLKEEKERLEIIKSEIFKKSYTQGQHFNPHYIVDYDDVNDIFESHIAALKGE